MTDHRTGPVRSAAARESILEATVRLLKRQGYDHLTMEGIAREAGVAKQTVYRWWRSRGALIADCMIERRLVAVDIDVPDTGALGDDLVDWVETVLAIATQSDGGSLIRSLVAAAAEDGDVGDRLAEAFAAEKGLSHRLESAVRAGHLPEDTPVDALSMAILGAIIMPVLGRQSVDPERLRRLVRYLARPA